MGCWNGTCGVSQLPIRVGDPVRAFLIGVPPYSKGDQSGYCYSDGRGYPMTLGFKAEYNDYGGVEKIEESFVTELLWNQYKDTEKFYLYRNYKAGGGFEDQRRDIKFEGLEGFINDVVERDHLYLDRSLPISGAERDKHAVGLFMVHEPIYQACLEMFQKQTARALEEAPKYLEVLKERLSKKGEVGFFAIHSFTSSALVPEPEEKEWDRIFPWIWHTQSYDAKSALEPYRQAFIDAIVAEDQQRIEAILKAQAEFYAFCCAMEQLRKGWVPQAGKGSQSEGYDLQGKLILAMEDIINAWVKWRNDGEEEYLDETEVPL